MEKEEDIQLLARHVNQNRKQRRCLVEKLRPYVN
jgi:hypothetical protein